MPPIWSYSFVLLLQLSLLNGGGLFAQSTPSKPAQFTLKGVDIGDVGEAGSTALDDATGEYSVTGSGTDIFGTSDEFHYAHMAWSGDGEIIARVTDVAETNQHAKAGVMFRESLDADSAHAVMEIKASAGAEFQSRQQKGKKTSYNDTKGIKAPHFVRLVRRGNTFTGYRSTDGSKWVQHGSATIGEEKGDAAQKGNNELRPLLFAHRTLLRSPSLVPLR